ncbi:MAG TPA: DUF459 domain-containing protein [Mycobacteriales bacterium]|jgi:hypothetical protein
MTDVTERRPAREPHALVGPGGTARTMPAGKVLVVMVVALVLSALFNSKRFVHAGEGMPVGWQRTAMLAVARPIDSLAEFLHTDRPRARIDAALGRSPGLADNGGAFQEPEGVLPTASPGIPEPSESPSAAPVFRDVSAAEPLKLFVTGDSMIEFMAPKLIKEGGDAIDGESKVEYGTGLVRDDFFDWPANLRTQLGKRSPEAVIVMMGGNDGQGFTLPGGRVLKDGTPEWAAEYQRRATIMMRIATDGGQRHVYWVGMPIAKSARLAKDYELINAGLRAAAASVPGATYVDIWADFAPEGRYTDFLDGKLVRARDGVHLNRDGATILMRKLYALLDRDWKLSA